MQTFLKHFGAFVLGCLCGFDRIRFRGTKQQLCYTNGIMGFLQQRNVPLHNFKAYAQNITEAVFQAIEPPAKQAGVYRYLNSYEVSPEDVALSMAAEQQRTQGLIAVLGRVEPCQTIELRRGRQFWMPHLKSGAKCLHYYHYYLDPDFGLRYTRLQTWFPFTTHLGINGREWLARQMTKAGIEFIQKDNCFTWVQDLEAAQHLLDEQLTTNWSPLLQRWIEQSHPRANTFLDKPVPYYWTAQEAEYATDILFRSADDLANLYPIWVHQAYATLHSGDLLRYMNYRVRRDGMPYADELGEVRTSIKEYLLGTRVRHQIRGNLLKMYDKMGSVLRVESVLNDVSHFKVLRTSADGQEPHRPMRLRKSVADLHCRAKVSQEINERYVATLAGVAQTQPLSEVTKTLGQPVSWKGRGVRALDPLCPEDVRLLEAVSRGEFMIQGFRNHDLRVLLFGADVEDAEAAERKRRSAQVTRLLRLLRGHGLIVKLPNTHRYQVTEQGRTSIGALLAARQADTKKLLQAA
jgi:hypothetical protein